MTFKPISTLSMILIFVLGTFAFADELSMVEGESEPVPPTTTSSEIDSNEMETTPEMDQEPTPTYEIEYYEEYYPVPDQDRQEEEQRLRHMYYEGEYTKKTTDGGQAKLASESKAKPEKSAPKATKASSPKQETTEPTSPTEDVTIVESPNVTQVSPMPTRAYSNRNYRGYTRQQIRNMPMVARPDRPGHFFGNTVRAIYRSRRGR